MANSASPDVEKLCGATDYLTPMPPLLDAAHGAVFEAARHGSTEAVLLKRLDAAGFNAVGELFDEDGIVAEWFASERAWREHDRARFARKFERSLDNRTDCGGPFLWITDRFSHVYYHWLTGALTRLEAASDCDCARTVLLPQRIWEQPFVPPMLAPFKSFAPGPPIAGNGRAGPVDLVTRTAVPPELHPDLLKRVRERMVRHYRPDRGIRAPGRRIYASRRLARHRQMANEDELLPVLQRHGFEMVALEELPFAEQVALMGETAVLAGPHGAGLVNAMFMDRGSTLLELRQLHGPPLSFFKLADIFGLHYRYGLCDSAEPDQHHHGADVRLAPDTLDRLLGDVLAGSGGG